jgi:serine/threonine protein kinase
MPPEYINKQQFSPKFDVFSLGVIIIQIMAGEESYCSEHGLTCHLFGV